MAHGHRLILAATMGWGIALAGCQNDAPPPPRVPVPAAVNRDQVRARDYVKPMPDEVAIERPVRRDPVERVPQREPERPVDKTRVEAPPRDRDADLSRVERDFQDAYHKVGEPRIIVFVNRTLDGQIIPVSPDGVPRGSSVSERREPSDAYLRPGQYDDANARSVDYQAFENKLAERFGQGGRVVVLSPTLVREKLGDAPTKELQDGRANALSALDERLKADVLVQVQVHPTRQTNRGLEFRVVGEAINVRGGQSIGHAFADVDPPLDAKQIDEATHFLSDKLMADMIQTWSAPVPPGAPGDVRPAPPKE